MPKPQLLLVYDHECPVCRNFAQFVRIRDSVGELRLINAREDHAAVSELSQRGFDLDQGMALIVDANVFFGADAMHMLAMLSSRYGFFNRLNYWIFRSVTLTRFLYPILRSGRNLLLRILGKTRINNLHSEQQHNITERR